MNDFLFIGIALTLIGLLPILLSDLPDIKEAKLKKFWGLK